MEELNGEINTTEEQSCADTGSEENTPGTIYSNYVPRPYDVRCNAMHMAIASYGHEGADSAQGITIRARAIEAFLNEVIER